MTTRDELRRRSRRVVDYTSCPFCDCWSVGVQANGRIVRHSISFGSVERPGRGSWKKATPICSGSGYKIYEAALTPQEKP